MPTFSFVICHSAVSNTMQYGNGKITVEHFLRGHLC
jgi:hypothetical protein